MGISISSVFDDVRFMISKENGYVSITDFNRLSKRAENRLLDWGTGRIEGTFLPQMYTTQKDKDFIAPFITKYKAMLSDEGAINKPENYYLFENLYGLSLEESACDDDEKECGEADLQKVKKDPIELLNGSEFAFRLKTRVKALRPSVERPIAKELGFGFEFAPEELSGVTLEYVRYPVYAVAVSMIDPVYNDEIIDPNASTNYEWGEYARDMLVWIICDLFFDSVRESQGKAMNMQTGGAVKNP